MGRTGQGVLVGGALVLGVLLIINYVIYTQYKRLGVDQARVVLDADREAGEAFALRETVDSLNSGAEQEVQLDLVGLQLRAVRFSLTQLNIMMNQLGSLFEMLVFLLAGIFILALIATLHLLQRE